MLWHWGNKSCCTVAQQLFIESKQHITEKYIHLNSPLKLFFLNHDGFWQFQADHSWFKYLWLDLAAVLKSNTYTWILKVSFHSCIITACIQLSFSFQWIYKYTKYTPVTPMILFQRFLSDQEEEKNGRAVGTSISPPF